MVASLKKVKCFKRAVLFRDLCSALDRNEVAVFASQDRSGVLLILDELMSRYRNLGIVTGKQHRTFEALNFFE